MPTYEYKCKSCGHEFEEYQGMTEKPIKKCPNCKKYTVMRVISAGAGIIFKGSGFYETDYRSSEYKKKTSEEKVAAEPKKSEVAKTEKIKSSAATSKDS
jgi:putative FmdB family regulatory protein